MKIMLESLPLTAAAIAVAIGPVIVGMRADAADRRARAGSPAPVVDLAAHTTEASRAA